MLQSKNMDKKTWPVYMVSIRDKPQNKRYTQAIREGMENVFQANGLWKKVGVTILISDKVDFKSEATTRDRKGHYLILKRVVQQEDITLVNIYAPNVGAP